ncbi:hypothetical protein PIB30_030528 [Stylosanthes scabra]|uniref:Uncharacterized protein n=1 Tax=Stylosanthes scabra TaxID=79078 RepID=A0ABU6Z9C9_9FABA|nr:hypothetical protein [Stylosanthes scabra]
MRRRFWKRKQEPEDEDPPEDGSAEIKSSENNFVHPSDDRGSASNESRSMNSEIQPVNSEIRLVNSEIRSAIPGAPGTNEYNYKQNRDLLHGLKLKGPGFESCIMRKAIHLSGDLLSLVKFGSG